MAVQWLAVGTFTVVAWIQSDWETEIPKATQHGQKKKGKCQFRILSNYLLTVKV